MDLTLGLSIGVLVYLAFALDLLGFLARDELWWRLLMLGASAFYLVYYYFVAAAPLWDAIYTNAALAAANLFVIGIVIMERTTFSMSAETAALYKMFPLMSPGQFRRILRASEQVSAVEPISLTCEGQHPGALYFVIQGPLILEKDNRTFPIDAGCFVGEIAYLTDGPASADTHVEAGARFLRWDVEKLEPIMRRYPGLKAALVGHMNLDLARKLAISRPVVAIG